MLAWCEARQAAVVTKSAPVTRPRPAAPAPASLSREWQDYIRQQLDRRDRILAKGIAPTLVAEQQEREKLAAELVEARSKIDELTDRLDKLDAAPRSNAGLRAGLTASRLQ